MYASLRFPVAPFSETEYPLPTEFDRILKAFSLSDRSRKTLLSSLGRSCADPEVLAYRAALSAEVFSSPELQRTLEELAALGEDLSEEIPLREVDRLRTVARFEAFVARFDRFCGMLEGISPESEGGKRCFRFLRRYGESYEYKELKYKAAELLRAFGFERGFCLALGAPGESGVARLFRADEADSLSSLLRSVADQFGLALPEEDPAPLREYSDTEAAVLTGMIRGNGEISRRMEEFFALYALSGTGDLLRLCGEAALVTALNDLYRAGADRGYEVCVPEFRAPGFYSAISGLCYSAQDGTAARAEFITTPLEHITVVCGPDGEAYLDAVGLAHVCASAGGLVFASGAQISPIDRLERDEKDQIRTVDLNENSLCLCGHLFDAMLPRQEEAAASEVLRRLSECTVRSVVRLCAKSNPGVLQKQIEGGSLPPCTFVQAGVDRTLEDLLKRHNLTAEELEDEK